MDNKNEFDINLIKKRMLRKYPSFGSVINNVNYKIVDKNSQIKTAATDGKTIFVNENFMKNLSESQQIFIFAHEVCHIALNHILRSKDKDPKLWNIATDAVINQYLKRDGLEIVVGGVDIKNAINYDAEELYNKLKEKEEKQQENNQHGNSGQQSESEQQNQNRNIQQSEKSQQQVENKQQNQGENSQQQIESEQQKNDENQVGHDSHSMWSEAVKQQENDAKDVNNKNQSGEKQSINEEQNKNISEKEIFKSNEEEKIRKAEEIMKKINTSDCGHGGKSEISNVGSVGKAKPAVNWKKLLRKSLEKEDEAWGHRFSDKGNNYCTRIEDTLVEDEAETEIILDTSGSVSYNLLINFLKQVKNILKNSKIKVGTFSNSFNGFQEVKREKDIDNLNLIIGGGTNFDAASRAFSKKRDVNKICFTDGEDGGDARIVEKRKDIVWICFENKNFKPDYGKVIYVSASEINKNFDTEEWTF